MPFQHLRTHSRSRSPSKDDPTYSATQQSYHHHQHHTPNALVQAAQTLSSIGVPGQLNVHGRHQSQQSMSNNMLSPGGGTGGAGAYSPVSSQIQMDSRTSSQRDPMEHTKRQPSFRSHESQSAQNTSQQYADYGSPIQIQHTSQQHQQQQHQQQQQQQQQYQAYQAPGQRPQVQSTSSLSRANTLSASQHSSDMSSKYLPVSHHNQSASTSALPQPSVNDPRKYSTSAINNTTSGSGLGMAGGYGGDIQSRHSNVAEQQQPKEYSRGSQWNSVWPTYAIDWCKWPIYGSSAAAGYAGQTGAGRVAIGSHSEDSHNFISILNANTKTIPSSSSAYDSNDRGESSIEFTKFAEATLTYPITRVLWEPPTQSKPLTDLLATSGDHLRLWSLPNTAPAAISTNSITSRSNQSTGDLPAKKLSQLALLSNSKSTDFTAPLTSLDWNPISPSLIITSSIDTTCTIWDIPTLTAKTQLIAHDKEVFDVRFMSGSVDVFASCGADGSVRMFDLRSLDHSTIIYEPVVKDPSTPRADGLTSPGGPTPIGGTGGPGSTLQGPPPLLRISASPHDNHLLATFADQSDVVRILDVRQPGQALIELRGCSGNINCIEWSPTRRGLLAGGGDDSQVLMWDLLNDASQFPFPRPVRDERAASGQAGAEPHWRSPIARWKCDYEVNNLSWAPSLGTGMRSVDSGKGIGSGEWLGVCAGKSVYGVKI